MGGGVEWVVEVQLPVWGGGIGVEGPCSIAGLSLRGRGRDVHVGGSNG